MGRSPHSVEHPLWLKITLLTCAFALVPTSILAMIALGSNEQALKRASRAHRIDASQAIVHAIDAQLVRAEDVATSVASSLSDASLDAELRIPVAVASLTRHPGALRAAIYSKDGEFIDAIAREDAKPTVSSPAGRLEPRVLEDAATRGAHVHSWRRDGGGSVEISVVAPLIPGGREEPTGYVLASVTLDALVIDSVPGDELAEVDVLDATLDTLLPESETRPDALEPEWAATLTQMFEGMALGQRAASSGEVALSSGELALFTATPTARAPWMVVMRESRASVYAPLMRLRLQVGSVVLVTLALALLLSLAMSRALTRPLIALTELAAALGR